MKNNIIETLEKANANVWEKGNMSRYYINKEVLVSMISKEDLEYNPISDIEKKKLVKMKAYYDVKNQEFYCSEGLIRNRLREIFNCNINKI
jgi:hypothetical protein